MTPPIPEQRWLSASDERREPSDPPEAIIETVGKRAGAARNIGAAVLAVVTVCGSAVVWGQTRASTQYVDTKLADEARANLSMHHDLEARQAKQAEQLAAICADQRATLEQIRQLREDFKELRGYIIKKP